MLLGETLATHSVEGFLSDDEIAKVLSSMDTLKERLRPDELQAGLNGQTVHNLGPLALNAKQTVSVFEPNGRVELSQLPESVLDLLDTAFYRRIEDIRRVYPSVAWAREWTYVEYGPGQLITSHVDSVGLPGNVAPRKAGAFSITLADDFTGGEFYVESCGSEQVWMPNAASPRTVPFAAYNNDWFRSIPKTRWTTRASKGTALFWGSQLIHGTNPVKSGVAKKILGFIEASTPLD
ncbi:hypothetical protein LZC95_21235 [Pendulispora brunnea]|uniref:Uncharacterized protein n=1 Tax=Pendulispora brunnea TaxID=2905690 RepID=A0ABZ2KKZ5_9BACT